MLTRTHNVVRNLNMKVNLMNVLFEYNKLLLFLH